MTAQHHQHQQKQQALVYGGRVLQSAAPDRSPERWDEPLSDRVPESVPAPRHCLLPRTHASAFRVRGLRCVPPPAPSACGCRSRLAAARAVPVTHQHA
jgi:hypothetical protein